MLDDYERQIDYMRISITDRCNLRCVYCMPKDIEKVEAESILTYEEILRICDCASKIGIKNIKITGGEPLIRKDAIQLIKSIKSLPMIENVTLTTNGVLLENYIEELIKIPIDCVNVSLDTLNPITFLQITGRDVFDKVWSGIQKLIASGIHTKINCVPQRGVNEDELMHIAELVLKHTVDVRFIEMMPIGYGKDFEPIEGRDILARILEKYPEATTTTKIKGFGPASYITSVKWKGNVGFINPISHKFCSSCNRIRLTAQGFLKPCLCYGEGMDLMSSMRNGATDTELTDLLMRGIKSKPLEHKFGELQEESNIEMKEMFKIGG